MLAVDDREGRGGVGGAGHDVAVGLQPGLEVRARDGIVLDDEDFLAAGACAATGLFHRVLAGASSTSRTLRANASPLNGFWRNAIPGSSIPCRTMASSV